VGWRGARGAAVAPGAGQHQCRRCLRTGGAPSARDAGALERGTRRRPPAACRSSGRPETGEGRAPSAARVARARPRVSAGRCGASTPEARRRGGGVCCNNLGPRERGWGTTPSPVRPIALPARPPVTRQVAGGWCLVRSRTSPRPQAGNIPAPRPRWSTTSRQDGRCLGVSARQERLPTPPHDVQRLGGVRKVGARQPLAAAGLA
jgi:hypothetical protein